MKNYLHTFLFSLLTILPTATCVDSGDNSASSASTNGGDISSGGTGSSVTASISLSPTSGPVGTLLTVTSTDFNLAVATDVTVNGTSGLIISKATSTAQVLVMPGSTSGPVVVTTGADTQSADFTLTTRSPIASQQGGKLVGTGNQGAAGQGISVALSADGNTAIIGGGGDNSYHGAAWVYTRSGSTWSQQGDKLVGTGGSDSPRQGRSVALSADGNTAIVGGYQDDSGQGAAWVFMRSGSTWSQQGGKLVGTGNQGAAGQGISVALSADGNTAIVGGNNDNSNIGAAWVYTRSGSTWSQQGDKLVGTGNIGTANQGVSVALSADGNTAIVGGNNDNSNIGAAWIFTRSGSTWSQQGGKLVGTGNQGAAGQGISVSLSADGNTAIVGGWFDDSFEGAVWVFMRSGSTWSQQGNKLVGTGGSGSPWQGHSIALSADGNTAIIGGYQDDSGQGAAWVWVP